MQWVKNKVQNISTTDVECNNIVWPITNNTSHRTQRNDERHVDAGEWPNLHWNEFNVCANSNVELIATLIAALRLSRIYSAIGTRAWPLNGSAHTHTHTRQTQHSHNDQFQNEKWHKCTVSASSEQHSHAPCGWLTAWRGRYSVYLWKSTAIVAICV